MSRGRNKSKRKQSNNRTAPAAAPTENDHPATDDTMPQEPSNSEVAALLEANAEETQDTLENNTQLVTAVIGEAETKSDEQRTELDEVTTHPTNAGDDIVNTGIEPEEELLPNNDDDEKMEKTDVTNASVVAEPAIDFQELEQLPSGEIPISELHLPSPVVDAPVLNASEDEQAVPLTTEQNTELINKDEEKLDVLATDVAPEEQGETKESQETQEMMVRASEVQETKIDTEPEEALANESVEEKIDVLATFESTVDGLAGSEKPVLSDQNATSSNIEETSQNIVAQPDESQEEIAAVNDEPTEKHVDEPIVLDTNAASKSRVEPNLSALLDAPQPHADDDESEGYQKVTENEPAAKQQKEEEELYESGETIVVEQLQNAEDGTLGEDSLMKANDNEMAVDDLVTYESTTEGRGAVEESVEPEEEITSKAQETNVGIAINLEEPVVDAMNAVETSNVKDMGDLVEKDMGRKGELGELPLNEAPIILPSVTDNSGQASKASVKDPPTDDPHTSAHSAEIRAGVAAKRSKDPPASVKNETEGLDTVATTAHSRLPFVGDVVLAEQFDGDISAVLLETDARDSKILDASESIMAEAWSDVEPWSDDVDMGPGYIKPASNTVPKPMLTSIFVKRSTKGHPGLSEVPSDEVLVESMSMDTLSVSLAPDPLPKKDPANVIQDPPESGVVPLDEKMVDEEIMQNKEPSDDNPSVGVQSAPSNTEEMEKTIVSNIDPPDAPENEMVVTSTPELKEVEIVTEDTNQSISISEVLPATDRLVADPEDAPDDEVLAIKNEEASGNPLISSALSPSPQRKQNDHDLPSNREDDEKVLSPREAYNERALISPNKSFDNKRKPDPSGAILSNNYPTHPPTPPPMQPVSPQSSENQAQDAAASNCGACLIM